MPTFDEILAQGLELLQREGRVSYRALKSRFELDNEYLEDLKAETIDAKELAVDKEGKVLMSTGGRRPTTPNCTWLRWEKKRQRNCLPFCSDVMSL